MQSPETTLPPDTITLLIRNVPPDRVRDVLDVTSSQMDVTLDHNGIRLTVTQSGENEVRTAIDSLGIAGLNIRQVGECIHTTLPGEELDE
ncbi:MAG: hypothetical protein ABIA92_03680 [Patescibacteria group bacterium]